MMPVPLTFEPFYIKICPKFDGWGNRFSYMHGTR